METEIPKRGNPHENIEDKHPRGCEQVRSEGITEEAPAGDFESEQIPACRSGLVGHESIRPPSATFDRMWISAIPLCAETIFLSSRKSARCPSPVFCVVCGGVPFQFLVERDRPSVFWIGGVFGGNAEISTPPTAPLPPVAVREPSLRRARPTYRESVSS